MSAWFGCWRYCECTAIERSPEEIPDCCPIHHTPLIADNDGRRRVPLNHSGVSGYGFTENGLSS